MSIFNIVTKKLRRSIVLYDSLALNQIDQPIPPDYPISRADVRTLKDLQKVYLVCFRMIVGMIAGGMIAADELVGGIPTPGILDYAGEMRGVVLHDEVNQPRDNDDET